MSTMLIQQPPKNQRHYYVECANWRGICTASDPTEGATMIFEEALSAYKEKTEISPVATVLDISTTLDTMATEDSINFVYSPEILANAGLHERSKDLQYIIENLRRTDS